MTTIVVGYDVIAKIVGELHDRMSSDRHTWYHWKGLSGDDMATECRQFIDLVWASGGGPVISQDPKTKATIKSLGISKVEWQYFVSIAGETLDQSGLTDGEKEDVFSLVTRAKATLTNNRQARDWEIFMAHTAAALERFEVPEPEKQEFLDCAASLKGDIVEEG